jgi:sec-independent protein translocase protein TatC
MALVPFPGPQSGAVQHSPEPEDDDVSSAADRMSFLEHLDELRKRLISCCLYTAAGVVVAFAFHQHLYDFILAPTRKALPGGSRLIYTQPGEAFSLHIQIALIAGVVLASPFIMYQVWRFIAPALYAHEKAFAIPFVCLSTLGLLAGAAFNHFWLFPYMVLFFGSFNSPELRFLPALEPVWSLYTNFLIAMGITFQLPTLVYFLAKMKLVSARFLARNLKYAILAIFIIAAVVTPTGDPGTHTMFAAPMLALYLLSIGIAWIVGPKGKGRDE